MAHALRLPRPVWAALAGALAIGVASAARHALQARARSTVPGAAGPLVVDDGGNGGIPVLFVHSYAGTTAHWAAQLAHLRRTRRAIAMNLRGHGGSAEPTDMDYAAPSLAQDIGAVADALGLQRFVLVGHSMGGAAAAAYAAQHPERLAGVVLVSTPGHAPPELSQQVLGALENDYTQVMSAHWASLTQGARRHVLSMLNADMRRMSRKASKALIAAGFAYDPAPAFRSFHGQSLIVDTVQDHGPNALYLQVPQVERQQLLGTSHWPHLDDPEAFNRVLDDFLARVPAANG